MPWIGFPCAYMARTQAPRARADVVCGLGSGALGAYIFSKPTLHSCRGEICFSFHRQHGLSLVHIVIHRRETVHHLWYCVRCSDETCNVNKTVSRSIVHAAFTSLRDASAGLCDVNAAIAPPIRVQASGTVGIIGSRPTHFHATAR